MVHFWISWPNKEVVYQKPPFKKLLFSVLEKSKYVRVFMMTLKADFRRTSDQENSQGS